MSKCRRHDESDDKVLLQHDNDRYNVAEVIETYWEILKRKVLSYLMCFPDLALPDNTSLDQWYARVEVYPEAGENIEER